MSYRLLTEFQSLFDGKAYLHRNSSLGDFVAMHLYEDLVTLNRSTKLKARIDSQDWVINTENKRQGVKARRGDGTFGNIYGLRTWIEYGFNQIKNELGCADYRVTDYDHIERWWEIVCCSYLMLSLQAPIFRQQTTSTSNEEQTIYTQHQWWDIGSGWKNILNNVGLITHPSIFCCLLLPWLNVFHIPGLYEGFRTLINAMNGFQCHIPI